MDLSDSLSESSLLGALNKLLTAECLSPISSIFVSGLIIHSLSNLLPIQVLVESIDCNSEPCFSPTKVWLNSKFLRVV